MQDSLRIHINEFASYAQAKEARDEFPFCGACKSQTKIQHYRGRWLVVCMRNRHHFGMRQSKDSNFVNQKG